MKKFWTEFKAFIKKGNVVDLAVAVVIGNAFNKIVNSLVNDVIMPLISLMVGGKNVTDWKWVIKQAQYDTNGNVLVAETALKYGVFIQAIIDFLIIALTVFIIVKIFKASREGFEKVGQAFIAETKELTKKQIKALKKLQKKASKKGVLNNNQTNESNIINEGNNDNVQNNNMQNDLANTTSDKNIISKQIDNNVETKNNATTLSNTDKLDKSQTNTSNQETIAKDEQLTNTIQLNTNDELINLLKEIRDTLKSNQAK